MSQTIINDVPPYTQASASGGQTVFGTNWTANAASDVIVYVTPVGTDPDDDTNILSYPSEYTVTFVGALEEVQVTLVTPSTLGDIVTITRMTPADRENLYSNTNFLPSMLNNDFGILTLVDQQNQLVNQFVGPRYNYSATIEPIIDNILPILEANQVWIKNNNNTGFIALTIQGGQVGSGTVNLGTAKEIAYYASNGNAVSGLPTAPNSILVTNFSGSPLFSSTLPDSITADNMILNTPTVTAADLITPALGTPSSGTLTNCTGLPSGSGILCTSTNNNASSGQLGEFVSSVVLAASGVILTNTISADITSITLTAGDWDVWGNVQTFGTGININYAVSWISSTSATAPDRAFYNIISLIAFTQQLGVLTPMLRFSLATTTTIYLSAQIGSNGGTNKGCGYIYSRRVR